MYARHRAKVNVHSTKVAAQHPPTDGLEDDKRQNKGTAGKKKRHQMEARPLAEVEGCDRLQDSQANTDKCDEY